MKAKVRTQSSDCCEFVFRKLPVMHWSLKVSTPMTDSARTTRSHATSGTNFVVLLASFYATATTTALHAISSSPSRTGRRRNRSWLARSRSLATTTGATRGRQFQRPLGDWFLVFGALERRTRLGFATSKIKIWLGGAKSLQPHQQ